MQRPSPPLTLSQTAWESTCTLTQRHSLSLSQNVGHTNLSRADKHAEWRAHAPTNTWFPSVILTQGDSARILTLSQRMEGQPTLTFPQGGKAHSLLPSHTEGKENTLLITLTRDGENTR